MKKLLSVIAVLLCGSCLFATSVWVKVKNAKILDRDTSRGKKVAQVEYGTELEILENKGKFIKVTLADNGEQAQASWSGWIEAQNTSPRKLKTSSSATAKEIALAGKGFNAEIEGLYAQENNIDFSVIDEIENSEIDIDELYDFITEGNLKGAE